MKPRWRSRPSVLVVLGLALGFVLGLVLNELRDVLQFTAFCPQSLFPTAVGLALVLLISSSE